MIQLPVDLQAPGRQRVELIVTQEFPAAATTTGQVVGQLIDFFRPLSLKAGVDTPRNRFKKV